MTDNNLEISNYAIHKQLFAQMDPLSNEKLDKKIKDIAEWILGSSKYQMLMCKEISYYTVFHSTSDDVDKYKKEIKETLKYRGQVIDITYNDVTDGYECWIRDSCGEIFMYYLFSYEWGVVEI